MGTRILNKLDRILTYLIVAGAGLRVERFLADRSLWLDEAMLTENILSYSFRELLAKPLINWQAAPVGFLMLEKLAVTVFGGSEYALRIVPLLAGLASLWFFARLAKRWLNPVGAVVAMVFFVSVESLVYYSAEVKQYGMDVTVAVGLLWMAVWVSEASGAKYRRRMAGLIGVAGLTIFFSFPAVFVLACLPLTDLKRWRGWVVAAAVWIGLFGLDYFLFLKPLTETGGLLKYWAGAFMPLDPVHGVAWLGLALRDLFANYASLWMFPPDVGWVAAVLGIVALWRKKSTLLLLLGPIILAITASATGKFPFSGRVVLFAMPLLILLMGAGCQWIVENCPRAVAIVAILACAGPTVGIAVAHVVQPPGREEIKPIMAYIQSHRQAGDMLYCLRLTDIPFRYYASRYDLAGMPRTVGLDQTEEAAIEADLGRIQGTGRVWVIITHPALDEETKFPKILSGWGRCLDQAHARGASVYLFDLPP